MEEQLGQRALAGAGFPHQRRFLSGLCGEADVVEHRVRGHDWGSVRPHLGGLIAEGHMVETDLIAAAVEGSLTDYNPKCNSNKKGGQYAAQGVQ